MIVQDFEMLVTRVDIAYNHNPTGALEIIPKPSGMGVFTRPTILSTHAAKDEFLANEKYDTNGLRRMVTDQGYECLVIEHSLHGRYLQFGTQKRDAYTRHNPNYVNPSMWDPPRPWSLRLKERVLTPIELCIPTPTEEHKCFVGTYYGTPDSRDIIEKVQFSARINFASVWVRDTSNANPAALHPYATLKYEKSGNGNGGLSYSHNVWVLLEDHKYTQGYKPRRNLTDELIDPIFAYKDFIPNPATLNNIFLGMVSYLLFPLGPKYVPTYPPDQKDWVVLNRSPFTLYKGDTRLTNKGRTSTFPILTSVLAEKPDPQWNTTKWIPDVTKYGMCRTECLFEWPIVIYSPTPSNSNGTQYGKAGVETSTNFAHRRPLCFVPLMAAFSTEEGQRSPIDPKTGRRICMGSAIFAFICTTNPRTYYYNDTLLSLSMVQIRWPITKNPIFDEKFDLADYLGHADDSPIREKI